MFGLGKKQEDNHIDFKYFESSLRKNGYSDEQTSFLLSEIQSLVKDSVTEKSYMNYDEFVSSIENNVYGLNLLPSNRTAACKEVEAFVRQNPEVSNSVRLYASYITYGSADIKLEEYRTVLSGTDDKKVKAAEDFLQRWEDRTKIKRKIFLLAKDIVPYGDAFLEKIYTDGKITGISYIPAKTMQIKVSRQGHPLKYFQIIDQNTHFADEELSDFTLPQEEKQVIEFEVKEIAHFNDGSSLGVTDTPLYNLVVLWKFLKILEEAMLIHKMTRARRFMLFFLDVSNKTKKEIRASVSNFTNSIRSLFRLDIKKGEVLSDRSAIPSSSDLVIPITKDSVTKVQSIPSDPSATQVSDLKFYLSRLTTNLLTSYIFSNEVKTGKEEVIEKAFMRMVRIYQRQMEYTIQDIYVELLQQAGFGDVSIRVIFPPPDSNQEMKIIDTIVRRMMIINQLTGTLGTAPPTKWVINYAFKDLTQFEIKELIQLMENEAKKALEEQQQEESTDSYMYDNDQDPAIEQTNIYDNFDTALQALIEARNNETVLEKTSRHDQKQQIDSIRLGLDYLKMKGAK